MPILTIPNSQMTTDHSWIIGHFVGVLSIVKITGSKALLLLRFVPVKKLYIALKNHTLSNIGTL